MKSLIILNHRYIFHKLVYIGKFKPLIIDNDIVKKSFNSNKKCYNPIGTVIRGEKLKFASTEFLV